MQNPEAYATEYDIPASTATVAFANLSAREVTFLGVSGKIGAGKDTVAPLVMEKLQQSNPLHLAYGDALKAEVNELILLIRSAAKKDEANATIRTVMDTATHAKVVDALWDEVHADEHLTTATKTTGVRAALQLWGTEVRRGQDDNYWVKKAMAAAMEALAQGRSVYITDARFPNEATCITDAGGSLVRLDVSPEEQDRRIALRDGRVMTEEERRHRSEISLDNFSFPFRLLTDGLGLDEVVNKVADFTR